MSSATGEATAEAAASSTATDNMIDPSQLSLQQLQNVYQQLQKDVNSLSENFRSLKMAQNRFMNSKQATHLFSERQQGDEILVPLTGSMYVPGQIDRTDRVLVDIGTGYYASKTTEAAKELLSNKSQYLSKQTQRLQDHIRQKQNQLEQVKQILQQKMQAGEEQGGGTQ
eukprot:gb/GECG01012943.1/.p1 GENE.gb/GECG01012943.1/~~gb/GECG01012943.1/.p1  ORF type:complete len:169 (+),score=34.28 gb/GECG01012943.1/:1-507(+)